MLGHVFPTATSWTCLLPDGRTLRRVFRLFQRARVLGAWQLCCRPVVGGVGPGVVSPEVDALVSPGSFRLYSSPGLIDIPWPTSFPCEATAFIPASRDGNEEIKAVCFQLWLSLPWGVLGCRPRTPGWDEGSEIKSGSQTPQRSSRDGKESCSLGTTNVKEGHSCPRSPSNSAQFAQPALPQLCSTISCRK